MDKRSVLKLKFGDWVVVKGSGIFDMEGMVVRVTPAGGVSIKLVEDKNDGEYLSEERWFAYHHLRHKEPWPLRFAHLRKRQVKVEMVESKPIVTSDDLW